MSFGDAVRTCFSKYAVFKGRASRAEYWWFFLFQLIVYVVAAVVDAAANTPVVQIVVALGLLLPSLGVAVRRLHDTDRTGWWILIGLVPLVGAIVLLVFYVQQGNGGPNSHGAPPADRNPAGAPWGSPAR